MSAGSDVDLQLAGPDADVLRARGGGGQAAPPRLRRRLRDHRLVPRRQAGIKPAAGPQASRCRASATRCAKRSMARSTSESDGAAMTYASWSAQPRDDPLPRRPREHAHSHPGRGAGALQPGRHHRARARVRVHPARGPQPGGQRNRLIDRGGTPADAVIADLNARILPQGAGPLPEVFYTFEGALAPQSLRARPLGRRAGDRSWEPAELPYSVAGTESLPLPGNARPPSRCPLPRKTLADQPCALGCSLRRPAWPTQSRPPRSMGCLDKLENPECRDRRANRGADGPANREVAAPSFPARSTTS